MKKVRQITQRMRMGSNRIYSHVAIYRYMSYRTLGDRRLAAVAVASASLGRRQIYWFGGDNLTAIATGVTRGRGGGGSVRGHPF